MSLDRRSTRTLTSYDIARTAGVSQATVSRVLNGNESVTPATRDKVLRTLDALGYVPNASARSMRTSRTNAIGVVASEIQNPYFPRLLDTLTSQARERGLNVLLWNDPDPEAPMVRAGVAGGAVDGVIFTASLQGSSAVDALIDRGIPVVLVNRAAPDSRVDQVTSHHELSGRDAADYFLSYDRTRVAAIFGPRNSFASPAREVGFRQRLHEADVAPPDDWWLIGETSYEHGKEAAQRLLELGDLPDAVFCSADLIAFGAISTFRAAGVRIPEDLWIMGNDGLPMSEWQPFDLTTHRQPLEDIAAAGMDKLVARMGGDDSEPEQILLPTELIVRGSTDRRPATS